MKPLLITTGTVTGALGLVFFLNCPRAICNTPQGYMAWVGHELRSLTGLVK